MKCNFLILATMAIALTLLITACSGRTTGEPGDKLQILATTSIVGDVVAQVGGEHIQVNVLLPLGTDPHTFEPRPQDAAAITNADIIFANGAGLEEFLQPLLVSAGAIDKLIEVSEGVKLIPFSDQGHAGEEKQAADNKPGHEGGDPHTWMDPNNVLIWVKNVADTLSAIDPEHAADYEANAKAYTASLRDLDSWIRSEVAQVPVENRKLVSDHAVFGYFADEYDFTQAGTITASFSTNAAPSAQELALLEDIIRQTGVQAVFTGETVNQELAAQVAHDTGTKLVLIYHGSLSEPDGPASSYINLMRYNVTAIVEALK